MLTSTEIMAFRDLLQNQLMELERKAGGTLSDLLLQSIGVADLLDLTPMEPDSASKMSTPTSSNA